MTLSIRTDRELIRAGARSNRYVLINFTAPEAEPREERRPINVAFVLDRSGSMSGQNKFNLAKQAVERSLRMLRPTDRFSVVVYDGQVDVLMPSSLATPAAISAALDALSYVHPRGSTDLFGGWMHGCQEVADFAGHERVTRVLLLTDGLANQGLTNRDEIARHAAELRERGVHTSTFGVGDDFDERLLRDMAHEGGGNAYYLASAEMITDLITSELGEALEIVMPRAAIDIDFPPGVDVEILNRFRSTRTATSLRVELGDVVSAQDVEVLVRANFPHGVLGDRMRLQAHIGDFVADVVWTYATHRDNDMQPRNREVDRKVAAIYAARARADATEANRYHDFAAARRVIEGTIARIKQYAGDDEELNSIWRSLRAERPRYDEALMSPSAMKESFYVAEMAVKMRHMDGKARRSRPYR